MTTPTEMLAELLAAIETRFDRDAIETFWDCEPALSKFVSSGAALLAINEDLHRLVEDPAYMGRWRPGQISLARGAGFALVSALLGSSARYIHTTAHYGLYTPVGSEPLHYDLYALPEGFQDEVFDPSLRLIPAGSGSTAPGSVLRIEGDRYAYDFRITRPVVVVKLTLAPFHTLEWLFNRETLHAWQANDSELTATQLRVSAYLLGRMAHPSSLEPLLKLCAHPHHAVRWAAIQNLGRISRLQAIEKLEAAIHDPHPHIRRAAEAALAQIRRASTPAPLI